MISSQAYPTSAGPGPRFRVGDWVRVVYNDNGTNEYVGMVAQVIKVEPHTKYCYTLSCCSTGFGDHEVALEHRAMDQAYIGMDPGYGPGMTYSHTVSGRNMKESPDLTFNMMNIAIETIAKDYKKVTDKRKAAGRKIYWNRVRRNILK